MQNEDELRERAIEFLTETFGKPKQSDEFTSIEIAQHFKVTKRAALEMMNKLVEEGTWETRVTYVEEHKRRMRLWRMKT